MSLGLFTRYGLTRAAAGVETTGILSLASLLGVNSSDQVGWQFTVGASDLTVVALRTLVGASVTETIRLWEVDTETVIATVDVSTASGTFVSGDLVTPVVLSAGEDYIVTTRRTPIMARQWRYTGKANVTFSDRLTFVSHKSASNNGYPTGTGTNVYGIADIVFT